jgi:hypothetical protein
MTRKRSKKKGRDRSQATPTPPPAETAPAALAAPPPVDPGPPAVVEAPAPQAVAAPVEPRAEVTEAPVTLEVTDDVAVSFFSAPPVSHAVVHVEEPAPVDPRTELRRRARSESGLKRRRDLARYVTGAVAVCFMICAAAAVRAATASVAREDATSSRPSYQAAAAPPAPIDPPALPAPPPETARSAALAEIPAPPPPAAAESASAPGEPAREDDPKPVAQGVDDKATAPSAAASADPATPPAGDPVEAREAKKQAQRLLDRGDAAHAIEAAKRSVESDPSDAETWLILGGAYLQRGAYREARESFTSCVHDATRGPRGECKALLR